MVANNNIVIYKAIRLLRFLLKVMFCNIEIVRSMVTEALNYVYSTMPYQ
jgi:hypothetical protein